ncbi:MAG: alpha/beta hydrolase [Clostridia bacterium]|nr:alpha/beta hydrolase [Clostridia bacterium]
MKKVVSILICAVLFAGLLPICSFASESWPIEAHYAATGSHSVKTLTVDSGEKDYKHYKFWYPADLETSNAQFPVIVFNNGTGMKDDAKDTVDMMNHLASWGFVCVTNDHTATGNGDSASKGLDLLLALNENVESVFCGKINREQIGVTGHSQGGSATINAASVGKYENAVLYKSICTVSAPHSELAASPLQNTPYDASKVQVPALLIGGTGVFDAGTKTSSGISPLGMALIANMKAISNDTVIIGRIKNSDHGDTQPKSIAYVTAWFSYTLLGDEYAAGAFVGDNAEIYRNDKWQDVYNKQSEDLPENPDPYDPDAANENIFTRIINAIKSLLSKIKEFFRNLFNR